MNIADREAFDIALSAALAIYDKPPLDEDVLNIWMSVLAPYSLVQVKAAIRSHVSSSKFAPKPADIIDFINQNDGRLSSDEAWAEVVKAADEHASMLWTDEMREAWFQCKPVFDSGDEIGARMAFRQHYTRLLDAARLQGKPVKYEVSLGFDTDSRQQVVEKAVSIGAIGADEQVKLLPNATESVLRIGHDGGLAVSDNAPADFRERFKQILADAEAKSAKKKRQAQQEKDAAKAAQEERRQFLMQQAGIVEGD